MTARNNAGLDAFIDPRLYYEVANLSFDSHQIAGADPEFRRVAGVQPQRIGVRNLVQPLRIGAARVNLNR
jgi:hypothetical protein